MNCLPTFFRPQELSRCSRHRDVCPFCWARAALETWHAIDYAFFASPKARKHAEAGAPAVLPRSIAFDLAEIRTTYPLEALGIDSDTG